LCARVHVMGAHVPRVGEEGVRVERAATADEGQRLYSRANQNHVQRHAKRRRGSSRLKNFPASALVYCAILIHLHGTAVILLACPSILLLCPCCRVTVATLRLRKSEDMLLNTLLGIRVTFVFVPLPLRVFLRESKKTKLHHNLLGRGNGKGQESDIETLGRG
jgi:hypothetical protein